MIVDSGCVWHVVRDSSLLVHTRPCFDSMYGADGEEKPCTVLGDLPVAYINTTGERRRTIVRNVRCVPEFHCSMLSVGQLWDDSQVDAIFRDVKCLVLPDDASPDPDTYHSLWKLIGSTVGMWSESDDLSPSYEMYLSQVHASGGRIERLDACS